MNGEIITKTEFEAHQVAELRTGPEFANSSPEDEIYNGRSGNLSGANPRGHQQSCCSFSADVKMASRSGMRGW